jgi:hypothetical protein
MDSRLMWVDFQKSSNPTANKKKELIEVYYTLIRNHKIAEMSFLNQDIAQVAEMIISIFNFIRPD